MGHRSSRSGSRREGLSVHLDWGLLIIHGWFLWVVKGFSVILNQPGCLLWVLQCVQNPKPCLLTPLLNQRPGMLG